MEEQSSEQTLQQKINEQTAEIERMKLQLEISYTELERLNRSFKAFIPTQFINRIQSQQSFSPGEFYQEHLSILFADIRGYTNLSEAMNAEENFEFLNTFFSLMEPCIIKNQGFIDKFMGDSIMALFSDENSATHAVDAAIAMHREIQLYNKERIQTKQPTIHIGIGINTGPVMVGTVGSSERITPTVIGHEVNLASRLEQLTKRYHADIMISQTTAYEINRDNYCLREIDKVQIRGISKPVTVYEVFDANLEPWKSNKLATQSALLRGMVFYKIQAFEEALEIFEGVVNQFPQDFIALEYLRRCRYFRNHPPAKNFWNGVVREDAVLIDHRIRRRFTRYALATPADVHEADRPHHIAATAENISEGGLKLSLSQPLLTGKVVAIDVFWHRSQLEHFLKQDPSKMICRVLWQRKLKLPETPDYWEVGLEILMLPNEQEAALKQNLTQLRPSS